MSKNAYSFSGYSKDVINVRRLIRGGLEIKLNPFISVLNKTYFYERCGLGVKFEAGKAYYMDIESGDDALIADHDIKTTEPLSIEGSFHYTFYFWSDRKSYFYIKYAEPLEKIKNYQDSLSGRYYFGFVL